MKEKFKILGIEGHVYYDLQKERTDLIGEGLRIFKN
jgi:hypothetical protein